LLLPYLIGLLSLKAGVRFTTFAVPVIVAGNLYLFYYIWQKLKQRRLSFLLFALPTIALFFYYFNIMLYYNHILSPFFKREQLLAITTHLNNNKKGYVLTWWDYGYALKYYTNKRTLIDNSKHHWDNFIVARTLFSSNEQFIANFDRFFVETHDKFHLWSVFPYVVKRYTLHDLLQKLQTSDLGVKHKNEIYYYFDDRILTKLPVIEDFAYTKGEKKRGFVWVDEIRSISTSKGFVRSKMVNVDLRRGVFEVRGKRDRIGKVVFHDGEKVVDVYRYRRDPYTLIVYKNRYLIGTSGYLGSFFFRAFFFNALDPKLFETLTYNKSAKIFRLRH
jgi:undecaprenyl-diphosphooligosaccharide--protein glycosyltransferase